jgi:hypothetical protein
MAYFWEWIDMSGALQAVFQNQRSFGAPVPSGIGLAYGGGFYAGKIVQGGSTYYLIVSPRASGQNTSLRYKTDITAAPSEAQTLNNGPAASTAMNSGSYPAAQFCEALSIGGFTDWYFPARDELELCYRNLKPRTLSNSTSGREKSAITYPEGNDVSGDTMGRNRNSDPTGSGYTESSPARTTVVSFQLGEEEAFDADDYFCSTEFSTTNAWQIAFDIGTQNNTTKSTSRRVRACRRVKV